MEERKVSNIHQLRDVVMEEWKRTPVATCEALVNSTPERVKAVLKNNGGHTKLLCALGGGEIMVWGVGLGPFVPVKGTLKESAYQDIVDNFMLPNFWEQFGDCPFLFQHDCASVHKARSI